MTADLLTQLRYAEWFVLPPVVSQRGQISLAAAPGHYDPDSGLMVPDFKQLKPALPLVVQGQPALGLYGYPVMVLNPLLAHYNPAAVPKVLEHLTLPGLNESVCEEMTISPWQCYMSDSMEKRTPHKGRRIRRGS